MEVNILLPDKQDLGTVLYNKGLCYRQDDMTSLVERSNTIGRLLAEVGQILNFIDDAAIFCFY